MATSSSTKPTNDADKNSLEVILTRLMVSATSGDNKQRRGAVNGKGDSGGADMKTSRAEHIRPQFCSEDYDPWKALSDQVNEEISRKIYDELDAQMMAEIEKRHEEQSRQLDEELDRQLQEQLDAMLEANLASEHGEAENDARDYYSENNGEYSSDDEEECLENLPWSEGGEGGIRSLGLGEFDVEHGDACSYPGSILCAPKYSEEELEAMVDNLYGEEGAKLPVPGAWGKGKWRPGRDRGDASP